eukprot:7514093-Pyramimonas_sp.AAC.1
MVPSKLDLQIRRLRWYQQLAAYPRLHVNVFAAMFGQLRCEAAPTVLPDGTLGRVADINPWAQIFREDML